MEGINMLNELSTYTTLPATDLERAQRFYEEKLGLEPTKEEEQQLTYTSKQGMHFVIYETPNAGTAKNTAMGWMTDNIDALMEYLRGRGVVFEEYDQPGLKTDHGVAVMDGEQAAWFKDSEGNILALFQPK
jgi:catechol 2,3-dioxygenase-like lactoylglutathione lyase family enzyme